LTVLWNDFILAIQISEHLKIYRLTQINGPFRHLLTLPFSLLCLTDCQLLKPKAMQK